MHAQTSTLLFRELAVRHVHPTRSKRRENVALDGGIQLCFIKCVSITTVVHVGLASVALTLALLAIRLLNVHRV